MHFYILRVSFAMLGMEKGPKECVLSFGILASVCVMYVEALSCDSIMLDYGGNFLLICANSFASHSQSYHHTLLEKKRQKVGTFR